MNILFFTVKLDERKNGIKIIHLNDSYVSPSTPVLIEKGRQNGVGQQSDAYATNFEIQCKLL